MNPGGLAGLNLFERIAQLGRNAGRDRLRARDGDAHARPLRETNVTIEPKPRAENKDVPTMEDTMRSRRDTWIVVCDHFHRAVGPIPTEQLAVDLAAYASEIGACTYRPVRLALAQGRSGSSGRRERHPFDGVRRMKERSR